MLDLPRLSSLERTALVVVDVQRGLDDASVWGARNNPDCEANVAALLAAWRDACGITTNHCCETTARVGANLGFRVTFVLDATHTFDRTGPDGSVMTADELARATATNLHEEFATVVNTSELTG